MRRDVFLLAWLKNSGPFMKRNKFVCLPVLLALAAGSAGVYPTPGGQDLTPPNTNALTLDMAVDLALANSPDLRAGSGRVGAAEGRAVQARLWSNPDLEISAEEIPVRGGSFSESKNTIGVAQTVPFPGKKRLDGKIGEQGVRITGAELELLRRQVARETKVAFYRVLAAERLVLVAGELVRVAELSADTARKRVEAGGAAVQEQLRSEIQLEQARSETADFRRELATASQNLATLLGRPDLQDAPLSGALVETPDAVLLDGTAEQWLADYPGVAAARLAHEQAELELRRTRLEPYPDLTLGVSGGRAGPADDAIVEFRVALPLPIIDRSKGRKREAQANVQVAEAELVAAERRLIRDWDEAKNRYRTAADQVAASRERILPKAEEALRLVQTGFEEGKFGFIDLLDTQRTAAEARLAHQKKLLEFNSARAELETFVDPTPESGPAQSSH